MQSLPVQFAGTTAGTPPAAFGLTGTGGADDSFASAFGQALANAPDFLPNGSPIPPKAQDEQSDGGNSDAASMAVTFLNCFVGNLVQPTPTVAAGGEAGTIQFNLAAPTTTPTSDLPPQADANPSNPAVLTGAISGAPAARSGQQSVAALASLPQVDAQLSGPTVATGSGASTQSAPRDEKNKAAPALPPQIDEGVASPAVAVGTTADTQAAPRDVRSAAAAALAPQVGEGVAGPVVTIGTGADSPAAPRDGQSPVAPITFAPVTDQNTQTTADASLPGGDRTARFAAGHAWTTTKTEATHSRREAAAGSAAHGSGESTPKAPNSLTTQPSPPVLANSQPIATLTECPVSTKSAGYRTVARAAVGRSAIRLHAGASGKFNIGTSVGNSR